MSPFPGFLLPILRPSAQVVQVQDKCILFILFFFSCVLFSCFLAFLREGPALEPKVGSNIPSN